MRLHASQPASVFPEHGVAVFKGGIINVYRQGVNVDACDPVSRLLVVHEQKWVRKRKPSGGKSSHSAALTVRVGGRQSVLYSTVEGSLLLGLSSSGFSILGD